MTEINRKQKFISDIIWKQTLHIYYFHSAEALLYLKWAGCLRHNGRNIDIRNARGLLTACYKEDIFFCLGHKGQCSRACRRLVGLFAWLTLQITPQFTFHLPEVAYKRNSEESTARSIVLVPLFADRWQYNDQIFHWNLSLHISIINQYLNTLLW